MKDKKDRVVVAQVSWGWWNPENKDHHLPDFEKAEIEEVRAWLNSFGDFLTQEKIEEILDLVRELQSMTDSTLPDFYLHTGAHGSF